MSLNNTDWIGSGVKFPEMFDKVRGNTSTSTYIDRINQSIFMILSTPIGSRFFLPSFGSRLYELLFEPNDLIVLDMSELYVKEALSRWEKRIVVTRVVAEPSPNNYNEVMITIYYRLSNSNIEMNYVYPFQRNVMELE